MKTTVDEIFRYEDINLPEGLMIELLTFPVVDETAKGYWVDMGPRVKSKWVSKISMKRFAYISKEEARYNFTKRKERQIELCKCAIDRAKKAIELIESL